MSWSKDDHQDEQSHHGIANGATIMAAETLRSAAGSVMLAGQPNGEERISVFWRVFGGTLLSIAALVCVTVYQQLTSSLNDLRNSINHLNESQGDLIKKDEFNGRMTSVWSNLKEVQAATAAIGAARERTTVLEQQLKTVEDERKELTRDLQRLRERMAAIEGRQAAASVSSTTDHPAK